MVKIGNVTLDNGMPKICVPIILSMNSFRSAVISKIKFTMSSNSVSTS